MKCRVEGRSASQAVVTAIGLDDTGHKRFVGVDCVDTESHAGWKAFLSGLRARGVDGVRLVVSDAHEGLAKAIAETFQGAAWQRCVTHLMRNDITVRNTSDKTLYADATQGWFGTVEERALEAALDRCASERSP